MKHLNQTQSPLIFEIEEIVPAVERGTEDGCDICRHCQLISAFLRHQTTVKPVSSKARIEPFAHVEKRRRSDDERQ